MTSTSGCSIINKTTGGSEMTKRVEHIIENRVEKKWCSRCKQYLAVGKFHTVKGYSWDDLFYICANCVNKKRRGNPRFNALSAWSGINKRVTKKQSYIDKRIEIRIEKDVFIAWYVKNWFHQCQVDRIDNNGHYEIKNIQLLTQVEHNFKLRSDRLQELGIIEPEGMRYCYGCESTKSVTEFYSRGRKVSIKNPLGLSEACKECEKKHSRQYFKEKA